MGEKMETDVVSQLHQLSSEKKSTLSETFKDFNLFVKSRDVEIGRDITEILETFHPAANVGKLFKVKLVDRYRVSPYVVKLLQSDDTLYMAQALKCSWFFEDIDDAASFVIKIVPTLSLVARLKIINKYGSHLKNTKAGDIVYHEMKTRYGLKAALPLLPACSENFIRNELPNVKIPLPPNITLALYKKYPSLTTEYIKYLADGTNRKRKHCDLDKYESTFVKLSQNDLMSFLHLYESDNISTPYMKLGRRPTKKLLKNSTDKVLGAYHTYSRILVDKTFFQRLSLEQFKKLLVVSLFPDKVSAFCDGSREVVRTLRFVKTNLHSNLIMSAFKEKYNLDMTSDDVLFKLDCMWIEYLPKDARNKWLENKILESIDVTDQASYLAKLPISNCMPRLKKLIESQSDPSVRCIVVRHLVSTIHINQDSAAIKDLFAYLVKRFRNEVRPFRREIVQEMSKYKKLYLDLQSDDWTPINDFINIIKLNGEAPSFKYSLRNVFDYQIQCALAGKGDTDFVLKSYLEFEMCDATDLSTDAIQMCAKTPYRKLYLELITRETVKMQWTDPSIKLEFIIELFKSLCEYNKDNSDLIVIPDWILDIIESELNSQQTGYAWNKQRILGILEEYQIPRLQKYIVVKVFPEIMNESLVCHLLRREPHTVLLHIQQVIQKTLNSSYKTYTTFFKKCRMYDSFGITSEMISQCHRILAISDPKQLEDSTIMQPNAVRVMAVLLQPAEYMKVASQYVPEEKKVEEFSDEIRALYEVQQAVCKSFVDVTAPLQVLPLMHKFTVGDFLKLVVGSLVSSCSKIPETKLLSLLKEWMNCPVSLRKHLLRLTYDVAPTEYRVETFVNCFKTEKNVSLRLVLFKILRNSFIELPGDDTFAMFKSIICQLTVDDDEALKLLINIEGMENDYISPFLELMWQLVDTDWGTVLKEGKSQILNLVDEQVLVVLNDGFCDTLVTYELTNKLPHSAPSRLLPMYLLWASSYEVQTVRFEKVMAILRPLIVNLWGAPVYSGGRVYPIRSVVREITFSICDMSKQESFYVSPIQMLTNLKKSLQSVIKDQDLLNETLKVDLAIHFQQHRSLTETATFAKGVAQLYKSYIEKLGKDYGYSLVSVLLKHVPTTSHLLDLVSELLSDPKSDPMQHLVATEILRSEGLSDATDLTKYKVLIAQLSQSEHPSVQVAVNEFFHSLITNNE